MGCDDNSNGRNDKCTNFNPRIPYGMRPHAHPQDHPARHFNPRIPYGMRRNRAPILTNKLLFQSTHPVWDATRSALRSFTLPFKFQSTHPVWDATFMAVRHWVIRGFQSTHPVWDATERIRTTLDALSISIHASRMGCDHATKASRQRRSYFNPRIPYGMRRVGRVIQRRLTYFNPRIPYGMRHQDTKFEVRTWLFQSTHPVWDATVCLALRVCHHHISIHASRMGCDPGWPS